VSLLVFSTQPELIFRKLIFVVGSNPPSTLAEEEINKCPFDGSFGQPLQAALVHPYQGRTMFFLGVWLLLGRKTCCLPEFYAPFLLFSWISVMSFVSWIRLFCP